MIREMQKMAYYETYYYANVIHNVLADTEPYLRNLNEWHEDREGTLFLEPFPKWSLLHDLAEFVIRSLAYEQISDTAVEEVTYRKSDLWVDAALRHHGFETPGFKNWLSDEGIELADVTEDDAHNYYYHLTDTGPLSDLLEHLSQETFSLLFSNRTLLARLNQYAAAAMSYVGPEDVDLKFAGRLKSEGVLCRVSMPEWVKRAVFYRDRGRCVACNCDLTGLVTLQNEDHFDHIIPLAQSGLNDVTNIQLLCAPCNLKKGKNFVGTWDKYEKWY